MLLTPFQMSLVVPSASVRITGSTIARITCYGARHRPEPAAAPVRGGAHEGRVPQKVTGGSAYGIAEGAYNTGLWTAAVFFIPLSLWVS